MTHVDLFLGALLGVIIGATLGVRHLRREVADDFALKLKRIQLQLDNIEAELNLAIVTRYSDLGTRPSVSPSHQPSAAVP